MTLTDLTALPDAEINRRVATVAKFVHVPVAFDMCGNDMGSDAPPPYATSWDAARGAVRAWAAAHDDNWAWLRDTYHRDGAVVLMRDATPRDLCHALLLAAGGE